MRYLMSVMISFFVSLVLAIGISYMGLTSLPTSIIFTMIFVALAVFLFYGALTTPTPRQRVIEHDDRPTEYIDLPDDPPRLTKGQGRLLLAGVLLIYIYAFYPVVVKSTQSNWPLTNTAAMKALLRMDAANAIELAPVDAGIVTGTHLARDREAKSIALDLAKQIEQHEKKRPVTTDETYTAWSEEMAKLVQLHKQAAEKVDQTWRPSPSTPEESAKETGRKFVGFLLRNWLLLLGILFGTLLLILVIMFLTSKLRTGVVSTESTTATASATTTDKATAKVEAKPVATAKAEVSTGPSLMVTLVKLAVLGVLIYLVMLLWPSLWTWVMTMPEVTRFFLIVFAVFVAVSILAALFKEVPGRIFGLAGFATIILLLTLAGLITDSPAVAGPIVESPRPLLRRSTYTPPRRLLNRLDASEFNYYRWHNTKVRITEPMTLKITALDARAFNSDPCGSPAGCLLPPGINRSDLVDENAPYLAVLVRNGQNIYLMEDATMELDPQLWGSDPLLLTVNSVRGQKLEGGLLYEFIKSR